MLSRLATACVARVHNNLLIIAVVIIRTHPMKRFSHRRNEHRNNHYHYHALTHSPASQPTSRRARRQILIRLIFVTSWLFLWLLLLLLLLLLLSRTPTQWQLGGRKHLILCRMANQTGRSAGAMSWHAVIYEPTIVVVVIAIAAVVVVVILPD